MANQLIKPIKKALSNKYGYKNVKVNNGRGTAWGWVQIAVTLAKPSNCYCLDNEPYCDNCRNYSNEKSKEVEKIALEALQKENLKPYTYSPDDGYSNDRNEMLVSIFLEKKADNKPGPNKIYALTGQSNEKCIANGNTWAESIIK